MTAPEIITYGPNPTAPPSMSYAAAMVPSGPGTHWLATGSTPEEARGKLEAIWRKQFPGPGRRGAHMRKASEPVASQVHPIPDDDVVL